MQTGVIKKLAHSNKINQKILVFYCGLKSAVCLDFWMSKILHALKCVVCQESWHQHKKLTKKTIDALNCITFCYQSHQLFSTYKLTKTKIIG